MKTTLKTMKKAGLLFVGVVSFLCAPWANADTIEIRLINGAADTGWITSATNVITFNGIVGNYNINVSTAIGNNGVNPFLDLNSINQSAAANPGTLIIEAIASGFTVNATGSAFEVGGTSSLGGTDAFTAFGGNNNGFCAVNACSPTSLGLTQLGSLMFNTSPFSGSTAGPGTTANPYSLAIVASLSGLNAGTASFDSAINLAVPEPASLSLVGLGLLGLGAGLRKRLLID